MMDLNQSEYNDETFHGASFDQQELSDRAFYDCAFQDCTFREAVLRRCVFHDCTFTDCDLSLAQIPETGFQGVEFVRCKLVGVDWAAAHWPKFGIKRPFTFHQCVLNYSFFPGLKLPKLRMTECTAKEADFSDVDFTGAVFTGTDFSGSRFVNCDLTGADFNDATHYAIDVKQNWLKKTKFALPEAVALLKGLDIVLRE
ncbi:MAG: pentapeptide repeat-containing protein [Ardenticatenaceae bacterium]|nr:pentapeptide repeat-containing protein [Ardenticatenaceae bacterium]